jgi:hypothetical protein
MIAEMLLNIPAVVVADVAGDVAGTLAGAGGVVCGPAVLICAPALYVSGNVTANEVVDTALDKARNWSLDKLNPTFEKIDSWVGEEFEKAREWIGAHM